MFLKTTLVSYKTTKYPKECPGDINFYYPSDFWSKPYYCIKISQRSHMIILTVKSFKEKVLLQLDMDHYLF